MNTVAPRLIALAVALAAFFALTTSALAAFGPGIPVSQGDNGVKSPAVAHDNATTRVVAWTRASDSHVVARRVDAAGNVGPSIDLSGAGDTAGSQSPSAVADPSGNVTVVWTRASDSHVVAVRIPAAGSPGAVVDISQSSVAASLMTNAAADGLGNVHAVWRNGSNSRVLTRSLSPAGSLGAIVDVSQTDDEAALWGTAPGITADATGGRYVVYHRNTDCHIILRSISNADVVGGVQDVTGTPDKAVGDTSPSVALAAGNLLVVWHRDGDIFTHDDDTVYSSLVPIGGSPGPLTQLSATGDVSMQAIGVAGGPDGNFVVAWQGRTDTAIRARLVNALGTPSDGPLPLYGSATSADAAPASAISGNATADVAWTAADGTVMLTSSAGSWVAPIPISAPAVSLVRKSLKLKGSAVLLKLTCKGATPCTGTAKLSAKKKPKTAYGKAKYSIAPGATKQLKIKLSKKARTLLRRKGKLAAVLTATNFKQSVTLKRPRP